MILDILRHHRCNSEVLNNTSGTEIAASSAVATAEQTEFKILKVVIKN